MAGGAERITRCQQALLSRRSTDMSRSSSVVAGGTCRGHWVLAVAQGAIQRFQRCGIGSVWRSAFDNRGSSRMTGLAGNGRTGRPDRRCVRVTSGASIAIKVGFTVCMLDISGST